MRSFQLPILAVAVAILCSGCTRQSQVSLAADPAVQTEWAQRITDADQTKQALAPLTLAAPISVAEGYQIQALYNQHNERALGAPAGYKVAYASRASQEKWGIAAPTFGTLFEQQHVASSGAVQLKNFINFHIEAEVAFTIANDIDQPIASVEELMPYLASVHVGLDVPDNRFDRARGPVLVGDVLAMNCGAHTFVCGSGVNPAGIDYSNLDLALHRNGVQVYGGKSSAIMGDPRQSVLILIQHLLDHGSHLKAGDVVLTGAVAAAYAGTDAQSRAGEYIGTVTGLPAVHLTVE